MYVTTDKSMYFTIKCEDCKKIIENNEILLVDDNKYYCKSCGIRFLILSINFFETLISELKNNR